MTRYHLRFCIGIAAAIVMALIWSPAFADNVGQTAMADGVLVYLGITPSKVLRNDPEHYAKHNELCPVPSGANSYHVMVALFDRDTGERIVDADVYVRVSPLGLTGKRKHFGAIAVAGAVTYCNYFNLSKSDRYDIKVDIKRSGAAKVVTARFTYKP